jgi:predicted protein tyrosine phosphatase
LVNALFICGKARMRSPTGADLAASWPGVATDFAGLSNDADEKLNVEQIEWADVIFLMERRHLRRIRGLFPAALRSKRLVVLNIPDRFSYGDAELIEIFTARLKHHLL